jgi:hypothetical protein
MTERMGPRMTQRVGPGCPEAGECGLDLVFAGDVAAIGLRKTGFDLRQLPFLPGDTILDGLCGDAVGRARQPVGQPIETRGGSVERMTVIELMTGLCWAWIMGAVRLASSTSGAAGVEHQRCGWRQAP